MAVSVLPAQQQGFLGFGEHQGTCMLFLADAHSWRGAAVLQAEWLVLGLMVGTALGWSAFVGSLWGLCPCHQGPCLMVFVRCASWCSNSNCQGHVLVHSTSVEAEA